MRCTIAAILALCLSGCAWLDSQSFEVCYVYKGKQVCAKRINGVWSFSADLSKDEQEQIIRDIEQ